MTIIKHRLIIVFLLLFAAGCKKFVEIPPQIGTIPASQVFSSDDQAASAMQGIYFNMINASRTFTAGFLTAYGGMCADELIPFDLGNQTYAEMYNNSLLANANVLIESFWSPAYSDIYDANSIISGLNSYSGVHDSLRNELIGESEFVRAFSNFYLVNLFGDIPLLTSTNWQKTNLLPRTAVPSVYQAIVADLKDAQIRLPADYAVGNGERIIPNRWVATALLARVYLYTQDWANAEKEATSLIQNTALYHLTDLSQVFKMNSAEAIWQLRQDNKLSISTSTPEGNLFIPAVLNSRFPFAYLQPQFLQAFEPGDNRYSSWVDSTLYAGTEYYIPYKYHAGPAQSQNPYSEYYMVFRLAEQYLIRAEARARNNDLAGAISDLNAIRNRAGLSGMTALTQTDLLSAIFRERRIELFAEWGHRWLDLKRTNLATQVLQPLKPLWKPASVLFPIPVHELGTDPNLTQNPGYGG